MGRIGSGGEERGDGARRQAARAPGGGPSKSRFLLPGPRKGSRQQIAEVTSYVFLASRCRKPLLREPPERVSTRPDKVISTGGANSRGEICGQLPCHRGVRRQNKTRKGL